MQSAGLSFHLFGLSLLKIYSHVFCGDSGVALLEKFLPAVVTNADVAFFYGCMHLFTFLILTVLFVSRQYVAGTLRKAGDATILGRTCVCDDTIDLAL